MSLFNATTKEQSNKHILQTNIKANANNQTKDVEKNEDYALKCGLVRCALQNRARFPIAIWHILFAFSFFAENSGKRVRVVLLEKTVRAAISRISS